MPDLLDEVAQHFGKKVQKDRGGRYVKIPGPGHSDADDGLKVRLNEKGDDFVVHSFNDPKEAWAEAKDWLREQLDKPAFLKGKKNGNGNGKGGGQLTHIADYIYQNADTSFHTLVKKYLDERGKKTFRQHKLEESKWVTGKPAGPKIPYKLPQLIKTPVSIPIYFVEGEKDADTLETIGLVGTTASEGAGAEWDDAMTQYFAGRTVIIIPDADTIGRAHAQKVAKALAGVAYSIKIVELYPDDTTGKDVSDFIEHDVVGAQLMKLVKAAPEWTLADAKTEEDVVVEELDSLDGIEKARRKKELIKELGITMKDLDQILHDKAMTKQLNLAHWACEPWAEPVTTEALLNLLEAFYTSRVILPEYGEIAMALWCLHAWAHDAASNSALLQFVSPVPECGKSRAQEAMQWTTPRGIMASNISPSVFYRFIDSSHPTLIIDEAECYIKREDVRGILDGSISRAGSFTIRNVGDNHEPKLFSTWGAEGDRWARQAGCDHPQPLHHHSPEAQEEDREGHQAARARHQRVSGLALSGLSLARRSHRGTEAGYAGIPGWAQ
jgi:hypothetical protein